jgi:hypothetical protein
VKLNDELNRAIEVLYQLDAKICIEMAGRMEQIPITVEQAEAVLGVLSLLHGELQQKVIQVGIIESEMEDGYYCNPGKPEYDLVFCPIVISQSSANLETLFCAVAQIIDPTLRTPSLERTRKVVDLAFELLEEGELERIFGENAGNQ